MKHTPISAACLAVIALAAGLAHSRTHDISYGYRMGAGFPGDVNRTHPASIIPGLQDATNPVALYGNPVLINTSANSYRQFLSSDTAVTKLSGVLVRPYPTQQTTGGMTSTIGAAVPPVTGVQDILDDGFIMVRCNNFAAQQPTLGGAVYIWIAASTGAHVQGGFESVSSGSTITISNAQFMGPGDTNGICEIKVWR